ncbi:MAG: hypothetical protein NTU73_10755 [Ignavibacteriae bacterium]|nr:hypothetical protein [Ignavibacteriota bacterium]
MKKFFIEGNDYSMMRLLSFLSVFTAIIITGFVIAFVFIKIELLYIQEMILLAGTLLGFGFGGKALQKFGERK